MHDLAPLKLANPRTLDWENGAIPGRQLTGLAIRHVKVVQQRASLLEGALGLPGAGGSALLGAVECLWIGPGEWLLLAPVEHRERLAALEVQAVESGAATAFAEHRLTVVELETGAALLSGLTGLAQETLRPGSVARTRLADIPMIIAAGPGTSFRLLFDRVYAPHMRAWLDRAI